MNKFIKNSLWFLFVCLLITGLIFVIGERFKKEKPDPITKEWIEETHNSATVFKEIMDDLLLCSQKSSPRDCINKYKETENGKKKIEFLTK